MGRRKYIGMEKDRGSKSSKNSNGRCWMKQKSRMESEKGPYWSLEESCGIGCGSGSTGHESCLPQKYAYLPFDFDASIDRRPKIVGTLTQSR